MKREYSAVYQEVEDGWIMATVPELPGAVTQGRDLAEARSMIEEAVELLLEAYRDHVTMRRGKLRVTPACYPLSGRPGG